MQSHTSNVIPERVARAIVVRVLFAAFVVGLFAYGARANSDSLTSASSRKLNFAAFGYPEISSSTPRVLPPPMGLPLIVPKPTAWRTYATWEERAEDYLRSNPDNAGLRAFLEAISTLDLSSSETARGDLISISKTGWANVTPAVRDVFMRNQSSMKLFYKASQFAPLDMPPVEDFALPIPDQHLMRFMILLQLCHANELRYVGQFDDAARRSMGCVRLAESFRHRRADNITRWIGISLINMSAIHLAGLLADNGVSPNMARQLEAEFADMEARAVSASDCILYRGAHIMAINYRIRNDVEARKTFTPEELAEADSRDLAEVDRVTRVYAGVFAQPYHKRMVIRPDEITTDTFVQEVFLDVYAMAVRNDVANARLQMCRALALRRAGNVREATLVLDPFAADALVFERDKIFSVGPDGKSQEGAVNYDPTNGTFSAGDIVHRW